MRSVAILMAGALLAGCGDSGSTHTASTATQPAQSKTGPQYVPSAHHAHRPPGSVYSDEVGENITTATRDRVIQLFGPPASQHGACVRYRIVKQPKQQWEFCFKGQKMTSATAVPA